VYVTLLSAQVYEPQAVIIFVAFVFEVMLKLRVEELQDERKE
jgi:hypothetical protein